MYDGGRHVLTGWLRDLDPENDDGAFQWGGSQCVPLELYAGPDGQILSRPVPEAIAVFIHPTLELHGEKGFDLGSGVSRRFSAPDHYLLTLEARLAPGAELEVAFRAQSEPASGYILKVRPGSEDAEISGPGFRYPRRILLDSSQPVSIRAFVQGTIIECFVNDAFAFSCRAYNHPQGDLVVSAVAGSVTVSDLVVRIDQ